MCSAFPVCLTTHVLVFVTGKLTYLVACFSKDVLYGYIAHTEFISRKNS